MSIYELESKAAIEEATISVPQWSKSCEVKISVKTSEETAGA